MAWPSWDHRDAFVCPQNRHVSANPCRMAAAFSESTIAFGLPRCDVPSLPDRLGGESTSPEHTVVDGRSHGHSTACHPCTPSDSFTVTVQDGASGLFGRCFGCATSEAPLPGIDAGIVWDGSSQCECGCPFVATVRINTPSPLALRVTVRDGPSGSLGLWAPFAGSYCFQRKRTGRPISVGERCASASLTVTQGRSSVPGIGCVCSNAGSQWVGSGHRRQGP